MTGMVMAMVLARWASEGKDLADVTDEEMNAAIDSAIDDLRLAAETIVAVDDSTS